MKHRILNEKGLEHMLELVRNVYDKKTKYYLSDNMTSVSIWFGISNDHFDIVEDEHVENLERDKELQILRHT